MLFVLLPLVDLLLLLEVGSFLGVVPTVVLTLLTGFFGAWLVRREGRRVWFGWRQSLVTCTPPKHGLVDGALVLVGAVLLLTPGVLTDLLGLVLLLPWTRRPIGERVRVRIDRAIASREWRMTAGRWPRQD
jgi:UPF0716 protein FxsA